MTTPFNFFLAHAGYSYDTNTETPAQGKRRCARALARAERAACGVLSFNWEIDEAINSSDFDDDPDPWALWCVVARDDAGQVVGSLGGVDFGRGGEPWENPYRRVVEAEIALEWMHESKED